MKAAALIFAALVLPQLASAHAFGVSHETTADGVHIDIGYSSAAPAVGESVIFDLNLPADESERKYTDVWVRVDGPDGSVKLATAVYNAQFGGPRMSYVFPVPGTYTISVRYEQEGEALAKTEWQLAVVPGPARGFSMIPWYGYLLAGLLVGAGGLFAYERYAKRG